MDGIIVSRVVAQSRQKLLAGERPKARLRRCAYPSCRLDKVQRTECIEPAADGWRPKEMKRPSHRTKGSTTYGNSAKRLLPASRCLRTAGMTSPARSVWGATKQTHR